MLIRMTLVARAPGLDIEEIKEQVKEYMNIKQRRDKVLTD